MGDSELLGSAPIDLEWRTGPSVIIPFHGDCQHRIRACEWLIDRLSDRHPEWQVVLGMGGKPWCKAAAIADGLTRADGDILIIHDADVWCDNLAEAVDALVFGASWVIPHRLVHRLSENTTDRVLAGAEPTDFPLLDEPAYEGWPGGGVSVLWRHTYHAAPMDPRFTGWGQEDASWAMCLDTLSGPHDRLNADLYHLWHPPQDRTTRRVGNVASEALWRRYRRASRRPDRMAELVAEGRTP